MAQRVALVGVQIYIGPDKGSPGTTLTPLTTSEWMCRTQMDGVAPVNEVLSVQRAEQFVGLLVQLPLPLVLIRRLEQRSVAVICKARDQELDASGYNNRSADTDLCVHTRRFSSMCCQRPHCLALVATGGNRGGMPITVHSKRHCAARPGRLASCHTTKASACQRQMPFNWGGWNASSSRLRFIDPRWQQHPGGGPSSPSTSRLPDVCSRLCTISCRLRRRDSVMSSAAPTASCSCWNWR